MLTKKRRFGNDDGQMTLNITSLMDILTIVLIFLVMSFSSDENEVPMPSFMLPDSTSERPPKLTVKVSVSSADVKVEDAVVATFRRGKIPPSELNESKQITSLLKALKKEKARVGSSSRSRAADADEGEDEIVYLEAEKGLPFAVVDRVLKTAAGAGFTRFRLAVQRKL